MSALELTEAISRGELSPVDVLDAVMEQVKRYNPKINAIVTLTEESARESAKKAERAVKKGEKLGPLHGVPITIKDNVFTKGVRTTFGSKLYENFIPSEDAVLVERLKKAGAVIIGKTNLPEFGLIPVTDNLIFGPTYNPWNKSRTSGGSSGGAAAAVAAGMGPLASGSDGGGSIRIPSSLCGVYGIKPSFGRVPAYPKLLGWETMDCQGPIARTVSDAALMLDVIAGPDDMDRFSLPASDVSYLGTLENGIDGSRIAYSPDLGYAAVDPEIEKLTRKAAFSFEKLGCEVTEIKPDLFDMQFELTTMVIAETITANEEHLEELKEKTYPLYLGYLQLEETFTIRDIVRVQYKREELWGKMRKIFENYDFLLTPTTAAPAFELEDGTIGPTEIAGQTVGPLGWIAFTYPFNFTGQPAASVPCGFTGDGLPVGLQIVGNRYDDDGVLKASRAFEKAFPWQDKKPPL
jgi:aspartyl-tRNA(Asn)/glutamyl-tRNA(Gln) amidotransferase subunit A